MKAPRHRQLLLFFVLAFSSGSIQDAQPQKPGAAAPLIPKTWDDEAIAALEVPLADPLASPKHVSAEYYYKIPVRPIFKSYAVFAPGHEPPGHMGGLIQQEPVIVWDDKGHAPPLDTEADWITAGEIVFDAAVVYDGITTAADVTEPDWYSKTGVLLTNDGVMPFYRYVIREKGKVELGRLACSSCHTRVMPDGTTLKGAQGNFAFDAARAYALRSGRFKPEEVHALERGLYAAPWLPSDPNARLDRMTVDEIAAAHDGIPPGVLARHRSSPFFPVQVPDLIGVSDRRYLDRTGLQQHRSIVDLMRYAALNQGMDDLANYAGFVPGDYPAFRNLPEPGDSRVVGRYSDEQLYALALYVYSLRPPPNPHTFDALATRGGEVFNREACVTCHTPAFYTNNRLTLAPDIPVPADQLKRFDILRVSVGTDTDLALKTRRGTGYYKVPSLKGLWYRGMFPHDGSCATLEDWFDRHRLQDDYVPTGFKGYGVQTRAVKGHPFGLTLSAEDKRALIAFLRTL
jgi:hypothetical protein